MAVSQVVHAILDSFVGQRTDPEPLERHMTIEVLVQVAEDKFTLSSCIGSDNDTIRMFKQVLDDLDLLLYTVLVICILSLSDD